uniref:hypothetical protein RF1 n=1 Tax=Gueldenstaedtia verna TaxID=714474 RepID=UPI002E768974|nr:hypothetical protein RF1 [Gueldenstaedtia verna]WRI15699.1 hypothetical protein RF1 [Gueldenstaedtia verna]
MKKRNPTQLWVLELREVFGEIKNSRTLVYSWSQLRSLVSVMEIFFHQERFMKLFDFRIWKIALSRNSHRYFTIHNVLLFVVAMLLYSINNRKMFERNKISYFPMPMNSIGLSNASVDDSRDSSKINRLLIQLLSLQKVKKIHDRSLLDPNENNHLLPEEKQKISFFSDRWAELSIDLKPTERSNTDDRFFKKEEKGVSFAISRESEKKEIVNMFKIIRYSQKAVSINRKTVIHLKTLSIHPLASDSGCDMVSKDELKSSKTIPFLFLWIFRIERYMNRDPNAYRYKWSNGSKNFQENLEHFISEQNSRFQVVFDRLRIHSYSINWSEVIHKKDSINWSEVIDKKDFSKLGLFFVEKLLPFLSKSLPSVFLSLGNIPVHRSENHIYEFKGPSDTPFGDKIFQSRGAHLKKKKAFLLDDCETSPKSKLLSKGVHTSKNCVKSFDSYLSVISHHDQDNWLNPVKPFHRSSLISSFYKANRLRFLNNQYNFSFYWNKIFSFSVEKAFSNNYDFMYGQFLNILFIRNKIFSLCGGKKKHAFFEKDTLSPIDLQVSKILIPKDFPIRSVRRANYSIADISGTPLTEEERVNFERSSCQPLSDMNLPDSEGKNMDKYLHFNSTMGLIHTPYSEKSLPSEKRKKRSRKKSLEKGRMHRTFQRGSAFSTLSKLKRRFKRYIPWFLTSTGQKYINFIFLDTFSELIPILRSSKQFQKWISIFHEIMYLSDRLWRILRHKFCLSESQWNMIYEISSKCLHNFLCEEIVHRNNESLLTSTHLRSLKIKELLYITLFLLLVTGYWIYIHFLFGYRFWELQTDFEQVKSFIIPSYMIELKQLLDRYPPWENWFKTLFLVAREQFLEEFGDLIEKTRKFLRDEELAALEDLADKVRYNEQVRRERLEEKVGLRPKKKEEKKEKKGGLNLIELISIIPNAILNLRAFWTNTKYISPTSKSIYSLIRKRKNVTCDWIEDNKVGSWILKTDLISDKEREFIFQFSTLTTEKRIDQILWSLTQNDHLSLSKNNSGYQMIDQPGTNYLRSLIDIHKKEILNYEFNTSCLAERRIFLAHYQTIGQNPCGASKLDLPSHGKPFSLRLALVPPRGILVIGSIGTGRSYLVKSLAANSYVPFITVSLDKLLDNDPKIPWDEDKLEELEDEEEDVEETLLYTLLSSLLPSEPSELFHPLNRQRYGRDESDENDPSDDLNRYFEDNLTLQDLVMSRELIPEIDPFLINLQLELAKVLSPCIIWVPNIHDLDMNESKDLSLGLFVNYLSRDSESRNILVIASTHLPQKVDPVLLAPDKFSTCIKMRKLLIPQQRKHFFHLCSTRGFHLENKIFETKRFGSINMSSNLRDLVTLTNQALSISIIQKKAILDTDIIRSALHRQTWGFQTHITSVLDQGILFYQVGRFVSQTVLLRNCPIDPISIYLKDKSCNEGDSYLYKWYYELGTSMKKLTILLYVLTCSAGLVAHDLWSRSEHNYKNGYTPMEDDSDLVHGLLEIEGALVGSSKGQFENDWLLRPEARNPLTMMQNGSRSIVDKRFLYQKWESQFEEGDDDLDSQHIEEDLFNHIVWAPTLWHPWDFLFDWKERPDDLGFPYSGTSFRDEEDFDEVDSDEVNSSEEEGKLQENEIEDKELKQLLSAQDEFEMLLNELQANHRQRQENKLQRNQLQDKDLEENDSEFLEDLEDVYETQARFSKERGFFRISQFLWEPWDPLFWLFKEDAVPLFSHRDQEFFPHQDEDVDPDDEFFTLIAEEIESLFVDSLVITEHNRKLDSEDKNPFKDMKQSFFIKDPLKEHVEELIDQQKCLRTNSSFSNANGSFRANTLYESYQYLANLFLSNGTLLDQMTKTLVRNGWLFPDDIVVAIGSNNKSLTEELN